MIAIKDISKLTGISVRTLRNYEEIDMWGIRKSPSLSEQVGLYPLDKDFLDFSEQAYTSYEARKLSANREC